MGVRSECVELKVDMGRRCARGWRDRKASHPRAGCWCSRKPFGVNAYIRDVTERFAQSGFVAISPDLFHRTGPGFEGSHTDFPTAMPHLQAITVDGLEADVRAAFGWLDGAGVATNTAAVGYCLGGRVAFVANSTVPLKAAASYYGGFIPPLLGRAPRLSGPMLFFWGGLDHHIPEDQRQAVVKGVGDAGKSFVDVTFSNADHGFFCDARASYRPAAASQAWSLTQAFFDTYCPR